MRTQRQPLTIRQRATVRRQAERWASSLTRERREQFLDDSILGCFDARDWTDDPVPPRFWSYAFNHAQYLEEVSP